MKKFSKVLGGITKRSSESESNPSASNATAADNSSSSPETVAAQNVRAFCESGRPGQTQGDEVTFLPPIVESAESSPAAAAECARLIRKFLHKDYWSKPTYQYNALMLLRILADNPGPSFTRYIDKKYTEVVKDLLRSGRDLSVRQMLMETLDSFEQSKKHDEGLQPLNELWVKEKEKAYRAYGGRPLPSPPGPRPPVPLTSPPIVDPHSQNYFARQHHHQHQQHHHSRKLPDAVELANRLEEARTSAKLLTQVVQCTPPDEIIANDLIKEFADRCQSASQSIHGYMNIKNPPPDNDTMESLIDTNEQLQQALNLHQRALVNARKHLGLGVRSEDNSPAAAAAAAAPPAIAPRLNGNDNGKDKGKGKGKSSEALPSLPVLSGGVGEIRAGPSRSASGTPQPPREDQEDEKEEEDPFKDPEPMSSAGAASSQQQQPRFATTPSYLNRQDSAMNKLQMHGADVSPIDSNSSNNNNNNNDDDNTPRVMNHDRDVTDLEVDELYDDDDDLSPRSKSPMYRY